MSEGVLLCADLADSSLGLAAEVRKYAPERVSFYMDQAKAVLGTKEPYTPHRPDLRQAWREAVFAYNEAALKYQKEGFSVSFISIQR